MSEWPDPVPEDLRTAVDEAGEGAEEKISDLEALAARLTAETGAEFRVEHFPMEEPADAVPREVEAWPDGTPCVVYTHWTGSAGPTWHLDPRPKLDHGLDGEEPED